jgi:hypothetical protein
MACEVGVEDAITHGHSLYLATNAYNLTRGGTPLAYIGDNDDSTLTLAARAGQVAICAITNSTLLTIGGLGATTVGAGDRSLPTACAAFVATLELILTNQYAVPECPELDGSSEAPFDRWLESILMLVLVNVDAYLDQCAEDNDENCYPNSHFCFSFYSLP